MRDVTPIDVPGPARRMSGFMAHLRLNGFAAGPAETAGALEVMQRLGVAGGAPAARVALKSYLAGRRQDWERFDELFDAYWHERGVRWAVPQAHEPREEQTASLPKIWGRALHPDEAGPSGGPPTETPGEGPETAEEGASRLVASRLDRLKGTDLRHIVDAEEMAEAERLAFRLASAIRYRLSRRRKISTRGETIDMRRTIRGNLGHGGEPITLSWRRRPDEPVRIVVLLDVSGSMKPYSRFFLQFAAGLIGRWIRADAFLFQTRLARVTSALRDGDAMRAMQRLSLMSAGFGGGTAIGQCLHLFNRRYAKEALDSRTVVIVLSDGYDTDPPELLEAELKRLKKRVRRLIWLNPLLGWRDYAPVARGMAAAMPHIDCFRAVHTLAEMARLEADFARL